MRGVIIEGQELAISAAKAAAARKAEGIVILDMRGVSSYCDAFVICHGTNRRQVRAIAEGIAEDLKAVGKRTIGIEGLDASRWVLIDLGDVLVHVFDEPMRGFYDLESLWSDSPHIDVEGLTSPDHRPRKAGAPARA